MTTDVSRRPRVASDIDGLVHGCIEILLEALRIDPWSSAGGLGNHHPRDKPAGRNRAQFSHRRAVTRYDQRLPCLHIAKNGCGVVAQLALSDGPVHGLSVADVAFCSNELWGKDPGDLLTTL